MGMKIEAPAVSNRPNDDPLSLDQAAPILHLHRPAKATFTTREALPAPTTLSLEDQGDGSVRLSAKRGDVAQVLGYFRSDGQLHLVPLSQDRADEIGVERTLSLAMGGPSYMRVVQQER